MKTLGELLGAMVLIVVLGAVVVIDVVATLRDYDDSLFHE